MKRQNNRQKKPRIRKSQLTKAVALILALLLVTPVIASAVDGQSIAELETFTTTWEADEVTYKDSNELTSENSLLSYHMEHYQAENEIPQYDSSQYEEAGQEDLVIEVEGLPSENDLASDYQQIIPATSGNNLSLRVSGEGGTGGVVDVNELPTPNHIN